MAARIVWQLLLGILLLLLALPPVKCFYFDSGIRWLYILFFSFLASYFITPFCRAAALRSKILDRPGGRKMHAQPTPLLGGLGVYLAFSLSLISNNIFLPGMKILLLGGSLIMIMGLWDDIRPLSAHVKFMIQIVIALSVIFLGDIRFTFFYHQYWAPFLNIPLTVLWIVGLTNALNFFDGMDGLATGMSIIIAAFLGIISFQTDQPTLGWFSMAMMGSCTGFMPHNFRFGKSARIFLGDAGSTFLGFTLAELAVLGKWSDTSNFVSLSTPLLIFGVLIFDMIYITLSRIKNRKTNNLFQLLAHAGKEHLHHRLLFLGFARKEVVFIISIISICLGVSALLIMNQRPTEAFLGILQAVMILGLIVILMLKGRDRISD